LDGTLFVEFVVDRLSVCQAPLTCARRALRGAREATAHRSVAFITVLRSVPQARLRML
jgi:hypothetical protein